MQTIKVKIIRDIRSLSVGKLLEVGTTHTVSEDLGKIWIKNGHAKEIISKTKK